MRKMVIAPSSGCRILTPSACRLAQYAIFPATGHELSLENEARLAIQSGWQPGSVSVCLYVSIID